MDRKNSSMTEGLPEAPAPVAVRATPMNRSDAASIPRRSASGHRGSARLGASRGWRSTFMGI